VGQKINRSKGESKEKALLVNQKQTLATQKKRKHTAAGGSHTKGKYEPFGKEVKTDRHFLYSPKEDSFCW
jgi:hypothetical protein